LGSLHSSIGISVGVFLSLLPLSPGAIGGHWALVASLGFYHHQLYPVLQVLKLQEKSLR
jgi:hypothetical protein